LVVACTGSRRAARPGSIIPRTCRTSDMPIGIIMAIVAASETNIETIPTVAM
jgi:hypothetical protein